MFPTSAFGQVPLGYPYPGQQQPGSIYQSQYGNLGGFNPQIPPAFQQAPQPRGQSVPNVGRQYPPTAGPYVPPAPTSSRRGQQGQYPPPAPSQHYEYRSTHTSKSKKHHKRRSVSPNAAEDQTLYSDHEQQQQSQKEQPEQAQDKKTRSRSPSPTLASRSKHETAATAEQQQQQSQATENVVATADGTQGGVARSEEEQAVVGSERRKSGSKRRHHHHRDRYAYYNGQSTQGGALENIFQSPYQQQQALYGEYQTELPPQLKVHQQPLYSTYNQAYADSTRQNETSGKHSRRSSRLPPEAKQKLLPHEDDQPSQTVPLPPQQQPPVPLPPITQVPPQTQQSYPYGPLPGYPQQPLPPPPGPQPLQPYGVRPPFNPYQPYGPPPTQPNYYGSTAPGPFNALQPWPNVAPVNGSAEQEIQRLRSHIHSLESELHKLQKKLNKATLNNPDAAGSVNQDESSRSHRRSKRDGAGSPRQTPVIVELNNTKSERKHRTSSKKHRNRTGSTTSSQQGQSIAQQDSTATQHTSGRTASVEAALIGGTTLTQNVQAGNAVDSSRIAEADAKSIPTKDPREETAAQLAHAAAAHVNNRQATVGAVPPPAPQPPQVHPQPPQVQPQPPQVQPQPPQVQPQPPQVQSQPPQLQSQQVPGPLPPPVPQVVRPQVPNQQQQQQQLQQQQYLYQQGVLPPQGPQVRGPAPRLPGPAPVRYPADPYQQQQFVNPQQRPVPNPNYNQSNNNELFETDEYEDYEDELERRSAEKILDAFERFYVNSGRPTTVPMKVKYIPDEINSIIKRSHHHQRNTNNNNRHRSSSRQSRSSSSSSSSSSSESKSIYSNSPLSSRRSLYDNTQELSTIGPFV